MDGLHIQMRNNFHVTIFKSIFLCSVDDVGEGLQRDEPGKGSIEKGSKSTLYIHSVVFLLLFVVALLCEQDFTLMACVSVMCACACRCVSVCVFGLVGG